MKSSSRRVSRRPAGLIELSLAQAAINCATSEVTLKRRFSAHRIQPNQNGKYLVADLLEAFSQNGDSASRKSLESHAQLQSDRAELTRLEIQERRRDLIKREPVMAFMKALAKVIFSTVEGFGLEKGQTAAICHGIESVATDFVRANGWPLLSLAEIDEMRRHFPHLHSEPHSEPELWARREAYDYAARSQRQFMRAVSGRDVCARLDGVPDGDGLRTRRIGNRLW